VPEPYDVLGGEVLCIGGRPAVTAEQELVALLERPDHEVGDVRDAVRQLAGSARGSGREPVQVRAYGRA
jgi:hypothetical protein